jgi:hypothetical protein
MKAVIHKLPGVFPQARHQEMESAIAGFARDSNVMLEDIEVKLMEFGMEMWPYCEAYEAFYKIYGEAKEQMLMREKLSERARLALDKFVSEGGNIESVREGTKFEHFFDADIRAEIIAAELAAHDGVHEDMEAMIAGEKRTDFDALLANHRQKLAAISEKIKELENLSSRSEKWSFEIKDKVKMFREGFAYIERMPTFDDVAREIQYYIDIMEV